MELNIIKWIQNIRSDFVDTLFKLITELGDLYFFILVVVVIYWLFNKKGAFKLMYSFIISAAVNQVLKIIIKRPRPYVTDPSVGVGKLTTGNAMPSGHAQNISVIGLSLKKIFNKKWLNITSIVIIILVMFSRLYLGQHYLSDVLVGLVLGIGITIITFHLLTKYDHIYEYIGVISALALLIGLIIVSILQATNVTNLSYEDAKLIYIAVGGMIGFMVGYFIDLKTINYQINNNKINKLLRLLIGGVLVAITYVGLSMIFPENNLYFDAVRYFSVAISGTIGSVYLFYLLKI